ncbi:MAG TPA: hypothetical protein VNG31_03200, partial [Candidatus Baltobacteraceae bacterium]|nr:hypothetical protein [Candidatus Baltobacteraceae bacterium]
MKRSFLVTLVVAIAALTGCNAGGSNAVPSTPQGAAPVAGLARSAPLGSQMLGPQNGYYPMTRPDAARPLCPPTADRHAMRCFGWIRTDLRPMMVTPNSFPSGVGYSPTQI